MRCLPHAHLLQLFSPPTPILGASCATVTPADQDACCARKLAENEADEFCAEVGSAGMGLGETELCT